MEHSEVAKASRGGDGVVILTHPIASGDLRVIETSLTGQESTQESSFDVLRIRLMNPATQSPDRVLLRSVDYHVKVNDEVGERQLVLAQDLFDEYSSDDLYFSVDYYIHPRFVVMDFVYSIRDTFVKFKKPTTTYEAMPTSLSRRSWTLIMRAKGQRRDRPRTTDARSNALIPR